MSLRSAVLGLCGLLALSGCAGSPIADFMGRQEAALRNALGGSGVSVGRQGDDIMMQMPDVTFDTGRATIKAEYRAVLDDMALVLNEFDNTSIRVIGHADSTGAVAVNQGLSEARARAVADYLQRKDVDGARLSISGEGASRPVASNDTVEGRAQNRRVEIVLRQTGA